MKIITSIILLAMAIIPVYAQEQADTLKTQELKEVVVEAQMQRTSATSSTFIPNKKQKSSAQNAVDLLQQLVSLKSPLTLWIMPSLHCQDKM